MSCLADTPPAFPLRCGLVCWWRLVLEQPKPEGLCVCSVARMQVVFLSSAGGRIRCVFFGPGGYHSGRSPICSGCRWCNIPTQPAHVCRQGRNSSQVDMSDRWCRRPCRVLLVGTRPYIDMSRQSSACTALCCMRGHLHIQVPVLCSFMLQWHTNE